MLNITIEECAIVILAAGSSARLGSPKQLLTYNGKTLLTHSVDEALGTGCPSVFVVLGANIGLISNELKDKPVVIVENTAWKEGTASSIRCGLDYITKSILRPDCVIFMVCDQPFVNSSLLLSLLKKLQETGKPIVASRYDDITGVPALFHKTFFPVLLELKGDKGARKLIADNLDNVATVLFPKGKTDIDTVSDYEFLKKENDH